MDSPQAYDASLTLQSERFIVLRKLNDLQAKTSRFPTEVLSMIFLHVRPPIDLRTPYKEFVAWNDFLNHAQSYSNHVQVDYLHTLANVSHLWRQVAITTPQLWTTVARTVDENSIRRVTSLLDLHFRNARNLPISIGLDFGPLWNANNPSNREYEQSISLLKPLKAAIFTANRAARIRHLALFWLPTAWFSSFNKNLSQCNSVTLMQPVWSLDDTLDDEPHQASLDLAELPCLKHIELTRFSHQLSIPEGVTSLKLRGVETDVIELLTKFTNLIDLQMIHVYGSSHPQPSIICSHLEHFGCGSSFVDYEPISKIQLPNIRSLHWYIDDDIPIPFNLGSSAPEAPESHLRFFSSLPRSLSSLTVVGLPNGSGDLQIHSYLTCVPQISELHFISLPKTELQLAISAIGRRSFTTDSRGFSGVKVLPNLRKLSFATHLHDRTHDAIEELSPLMFVEMLEALHSGGGSQSDFQLIFDEFREDFHDPLVRRRLRALKKEGFDIEIVLGSHTLDFSDDAAD